jgi:hypothetical protein
MRVRFKEAFYQRVIAQDIEQAEPALRLLAEEARELLPHSAYVRQLLLVASSNRQASPPTVIVPSLRL